MRNQNYLLISKNIRNILSIIRVKCFFIFNFKQFVERHLVYLLLVLTLNLGLDYESDQDDKG